MYGFIIKKNFCDGWDNLFSLIVTNVLYLFTCLGTVLLSATIANHWSDNASEPLFFVIQAIIILVGLIILSIITFAYGELAVKIADFCGVNLLEFFKAIPGVLKDAILFALMVCGIICVSAFSIRYYLVEQQSMAGLCIGSLLFWVDVFIFLSLQWFVPLRSAMHNNFGKTLKKCFIIFFDNTGFSILMALNNLVALALTVLFIGLLPSMAGMLINKQNALRIRLYKYDYLEEHPELKTKKERRNIPWEELIFDDREALGPRKLRSFLFPWKED